MATTHASSPDRLRQLMPPPPPRAPTLATVQLAGDQGLAKAVLPEEDYTEAVAAIIERDYFPDIPKIRNQLEWVRAVNSGDPTLIRQAQINIARRRAGLTTPQIQSGAGTPAGATPGGWNATPGTTLLRTPAMTPLVGNQGSASAQTPLLHDDASQGGPSSITAPVEQLRAPPMSLDTFLTTHTSEDNASFAKLHTKDLVRKRQRAAHLLEDKNKPLLLEGPDANPTEGFGTGGQEPGTLVITRHNPHNALYYVPDQKPMSAKEAQEIAQRPAKLINIKGTRLKASEESVAAGGAAAGGAAAAAAAGVGMPGATPGIGGFDRLSTPAFTPSNLPGASPLMTWGDIASTPLRLDDLDVPLDPDAFKGPAFEVPSMPKREQMGHELAAARSLGELKRRQREAKRTAQLAAGLPAGAGAVLPGSSTQRSMQRPGSGVLGTPGRVGGLAGMSPAAQQLAKKLKERQARQGTGGRTPSAAAAADKDKFLRASYSAGGKTPVVAAGAASRGAVPRPPAPPKPVLVSVGAKASKQDGQQDGGKKSITDDLLHI